MVAKREINGLGLGSRTGGRKNGPKTNFCKAQNVYFLTWRGTELLSLKGIWCWFGFWSSEGELLWRRFSRGLTGRKLNGRKGVQGLHDRANKGLGLLCNLGIGRFRVSAIEILPDPLVWILTQGAES